LRRRADRMARLQTRINDRTHAGQMSDQHERLPWS
jgi:hypothetical protein